MHINFVWVSGTYRKDFFTGLSGGTDKQKQKKDYHFQMFNRGCWKSADYNLSKTLGSWSDVTGKGQY